MVWKKRDVLFLPGFGLIFMFILMNLGCTGQIHTVPKPEPIQQSFLPVGYTIQTGAFSVLDNAIRMTERLNKQGLEAFYFKHESGLFKVRLGNFSSFKEADLLAKTLLVRKIIADYFIVLPGGPTVAIRRSDRESSFRDTLIDTAKGFISYPYTWGGESPEEGFDCSGLVLAVYRINGLKLPRTSREQYTSGKSVRKTQLKKGDLVFFNTKKGVTVSHVGIYAGKNLFIHAPGRNKAIRYDSLASPYYKNSFVGACSYF